MCTNRTTAIAIVCATALWAIGLSFLSITDVLQAEGPAKPAAAGKGDLGVAVWSGDGSAADSVGTHHGQVSEGVTYTADRRGAAASAFLFDGKGGHVTIPDDDALDTDDAFTLCLWVYRTYRDDGRAMSILRKWKDINVYGDYVLQMSNSGQMCFVVAHADPKPVQDHIYAKTLIGKGEWTHVAATFNRGTMKLYIDGKCEATKTSDKVKHTMRKEYEHDNVVISAPSGTGKDEYAFKGAIDDVCIYGRALTAAEVLNRYHFGPCAPPPLGRCDRGDRMLLDDGSVLVGTITNKRFALTASFGKFDIPAARVAGFVRAGRDRKHVRMVLIDGQVLIGKPASKQVHLQLPGGSTLNIPWDSIRRCGCRITKAKPATLRTSWPMAVLTDGRRLALANKDLKLRIETPNGTMTVSGGDLACVEATDARGSVHWLRRRNGAAISGAVLPAKLTLKLRLGGQATVDRQSVCRLVFAPDHGRSPVSRKTRPAKVESPKPVQGEMIGEVGFVKAGEAMIVGDVKGHGHVTMDRWSARLTPDGRHLLYARWRGRFSSSGAVATRKGARRLVLKNLEDGSETELPGPAIDIAPDYVAFFMSMRIFDAKGRRIAVPCGIDADGDGICVIRKEQMRLGIYDMTTHRLTQYKPQAPAIVPTFDRTGKRLLVMAMTDVMKNAGTLYASPADTIKLTKMSAPGCPLTPCPTADVTPFLRVDDKWQRSLFLYDLVKKKKVADVPIHVHNSALSRHNPQWTPDGRYLCYVDLEINKADKLFDAKRLCRIWDRTSGKLVRTIADAVPIAPGPTPTTMIVQATRGGRITFMLHDVATGATRRIVGCTRIISTSGRKVVYMNVGPERKETVYIAEFQLSDEKPG